LIGAAVVLLIAAAVPLLIPRSAQDGPDDVARSYFEALAERDADRALALLDLDSRTQVDPLMLTNQLLNDPGYIPPSEFNLKVRHSLTDTSTVTVDYHIDHSKQRLDLALIRDGESAGWRIQNGLLPLQLPSNKHEWDTFLVAGTAVPATLHQLDAVFPGAYTVAPVGNALRGAPPVTVWAGTPQEPVLLVNPRPTVHEAIEPQVRAYLDNCAKSRELAPPRCPFRGQSYWPVTNVNWKIAHYPILTLVFLSSGNAVSVNGDAGVAEVTGGTTSPVAPEFAYSTTFSMHGTARVVDGEIVFIPT
jgi:hypothetical protein